MDNVQKWREILVQIKDTDLSQLCVLITILGLKTYFTLLQMIIGGFKGQTFRKIP